MLYTLQVYIVVYCNRSIFIYNTFVCHQYTSIYFFFFFFFKALTGKIKSKVLFYMGEAQ